MNSDDTDQTVYAVAFDGDKFLMVWNPKRNGWEMPGGHMKKGETPEEGARREFMEEAGHDIAVIKTRDLRYCKVCSAILGEPLPSKAEMKYELFTDIPEQLAFSREEYEEVIPWAKSSIAGSN